MYTRVNWKNKEDSATTPINAYNLNVMDKGIEDLSKKLVPATADKVGLVKPDGKTTRVLVDGTLVAIGGGGGGGGTSTDAIDINYVDTTGLGANNVQNAIENVDVKVNTKANATEIDSKFNEYQDSGYLPKEGVESKSNVELTEELANKIVITYHTALPTNPQGVGACPIKQGYTPISILATTWSAIVTPFYYPPTNLWYYTALMNGVLANNTPFDAYIVWLKNS